MNVVEKTMVVNTFVLIQLAPTIVCAETDTSFIKMEEHVWVRLFYILSLV